VAVGGPPGQERLAASGAGGAVAVWSASPADWADRVCSLVGEAADSPSYAAVGSLPAERPCATPGAPGVFGPAAAADG
jgi:hypothetical protein